MQQPIRVLGVLEYNEEERSFSISWNQCVELEDTLAYSGLCPPQGYLDYSSWLLIPSLCNAHIHLPDFSIVEHGENEPLEVLVEPPNGLKYKLLKNLGVLVFERISEALAKLQGLGISCLAAYLELEESKLNLLLGKATREVGLIPLIQPPEKRLSTYLDTIRVYHGLGMDTLFDLGEHELRELNRVVAQLGAVVEVHVSESKELYSRRDYERLNDLPHAIAVHLTHLNKQELQMVAASSRGMVFCPRSNSFHSSRFPPLKELYSLWRQREVEHIALGTDNAAWIPLDPLGEAQYAYILLHPVLRNHAEEYSSMLLYMVTVGCYKLLGCNPTRPYLLIRLPEAKWSGSITSTLVKRGAEAERRILVK